MAADAGQVMTGEADEVWTWHVVATKPNAEKQAFRSISRLGFVVFAPLIPVQIRHGRKDETVLKPAFPNYVFVPAERGQVPWQRIASAYGVSRILTTGAPHYRLLALPAGFVEQLMNASTGTEELPKPRLFGAGDKVMMPVGPYSEVVGKVMGLDRSGRVRLLMRLLGGDREIVVAPDKLKLVG